MVKKLGSNGSYISPTAEPEPFLPLLAPSPLTPFKNNTVPTLSDFTYNHYIIATNYNVDEVMCDREESTSMTDVSFPEWDDQTSADYYFDSYSHFGIHESDSVIYESLRRLHLMELSIGTLKANSCSIVGLPHCRYNKKRIKFCIEITES